MLYLDPTASQHPQQRLLRADRWWTDIVRSVFGEPSFAEWSMTRIFYACSHVNSNRDAANPIYFNDFQFHTDSSPNSRAVRPIVRHWYTHSENSHQTKLREESSIGLPLMFGLLPFANPVLFSCQSATTVPVQFATSDSFIRWTQIWCQEVAMSGSKPAVDPCMTPVTLSHGTDQDLITNHYAIVWSTFAATCQGEP